MYDVQWQWVIFPGWLQGFEFVQCFSRWQKPALTIFQRLYFWTQLNVKELLKGMLIQLKLTLAALIMRRMWIVGVRWREKPELLSVSSASIKQLE